MAWFFMATLLFSRERIHSQPVRAASGESHSDPPRSTQAAFESTISAERVTLFGRYSNAPSNINVRGGTVNEVSKTPNTERKG